MTVSQGGLWFRDRLRTLATYGRIADPLVVTVELDPSRTMVTLESADPDWRSSIQLVAGDVPQLVELQMRAPCNALPECVRVDVGEPQDGGGDADQQTVPVLPLDRPLDGSPVPALYIYSGSGLSRSALQDLG